MWISTRAQYGMRALVEIALGGSKPTSLKTISDRHDISQHYLEQIVAELRRAGIVESIRGAHGGYRLAKDLNEVSALEVVSIMEGSLAPVACIDDEASCAHTGNCSTESLWNDVDQAVRNVLASTSLEKLVKQREFLQIEELPNQFQN